ncbi:MAG: hypothetical protein JWN70_5040, partial [Planctomycetaceae bacterium]|nr:hypothetical protein [Planctomycetaceae bacterium]
MLTRRELLIASAQMGIACANPVAPSRTRGDAAAG